VTLGSTNLFTQKELIAYFLLATSISDITMADSGNLGRTLRRSIRSGGINQILIKPMNAIFYMYSETLGQIGTKIILAILSLLVALTINPPTTPLSALLFIFFLINSFCISFAYNLFEGSLALNITEVNGIKNAMHHISRLLSGQIVPLTFFSEHLRNLLLVTPVPYLAFVPISILTIKTIDSNTLAQILIAIFWSITLNLLVLSYWRTSLKKYDAAGN